MYFPLACPHCNLETLVESHYAGQTGPCAACGKPITVPIVTSLDMLGENEVIVGIPQLVSRSILAGVSLIIAGLMVGMLVILMTVSFVFPTVSAGRSYLDKYHCDAHLKRVASALLAYQDEHGTLPPAYVVDGQGKPMYSWRVLILPYLGEAGLYEHFELSQPWDSAENHELIRRMPEVFACPADPDSRLLGETNYMVVVGPNTLFPGSKPRATTEAIDGEGLTLLVVETPALGIAWTEPVDLTIPKMQFIINGENGNEIRSYHTYGAHVAMADGNVRFLIEMLPPSFVEAMTTINGREPLSEAAIREQGQSW